VLEKVADMQTQLTSEPTGSRVPGVIPEPIRPRNPASRVLAKLVSVLRGDKYMVLAYPPEWRGAARAREAEPSTTARTAPAVSGTKAG
jgi:hypothetical protein